MQRDTAEARAGARSGEDRPNNRPAAVADGPSPRPRRRAALTALGLTLALAGSAVMLGATWLLVAMNPKDWPMAMFTRDPSAAMGVWPGVGIISNMGVLFWAASASCCLFSAALITSVRGFRPAMFCWVAGAFTAIICLDDVFVLHEKIWPLLGLHSLVLAGVYAAMGLAVFILALRVASRPSILLLLFAGLMLAVSVGADTINDSQLNVYISIATEDGFKIVGIAFWSGFVVPTAYAICRAALWPEAHG